MRALSTLTHWFGRRLIRGLVARHSASLVLAATVALAAGASGYLGQSTSPTRTIGPTACSDQNYAWDTYGPNTDYAYCPENAPAH